ncbi:hypothetical protein EBB07_28345 [Paenibacillaceae bacterium]|nr:hypothetical protein EBB07_28345 [Paenibacillaceae bacterium]
MKTDRWGDIIPINCHSQEVKVSSGDLLIANTSDFDLTEGKVYVCKTSYCDIEVVNDKGKLERYSYEWFDVYQGNIVKGY